MEILFVITVVVALVGWAGFFITRFIERPKLQFELRQTKDRVSSLNAIPRTVSLVSDKKHGLRYLERTNTSGSGWSWTCQCDRHGVLSTYDGIKPTEERAILDWRKHVEIHERLILPTNELSHQECDARFVGLWSLFEKYRTACYCQQTNDELILLNQEVKKFEKVPEKGVQLEA